MIRERKKFDVEVKKEIRKTWVRKEIIDAIGQITLDSSVSISSKN